jgi:hypothetical protein
MELVMTLLAITFFIAGFMVLLAKHSGMPAFASRLYRVDDIAVSATLFVLGACMVVLEIAG